MAPPPAALAAVRPQPDLIALTMGGNDVGFSTVLTGCFLIYTSGRGDCDTGGVLATAAAKIRAEQVEISPLLSEHSFPSGEAGIAALGLYPGADMTARTPG